MSPMTTVGSESIQSTNNRATRRPGKRKCPRAKPRGSPMARLAASAMAVTAAVAHTAENVSGSRLTSSSTALAKPSLK